MAESPASDHFDEIPPVFKINLSLPPAERYVELATIYRERMRALCGLFDEIIMMISPKIPVQWVHRIARLSLTRLYSREETEELRGISRATGIDMYLLVCFNSILDLLMGCTSGGVRVSGNTSGNQKPRMLHFRTLDWDMDALRDLIVQLDFVRDSDAEEVLATSITYAGFVGVLTGVRKEMSVSLNFRAVHDTSRDFAFYSNHLLVLLGLRRSISSTLRQCILPSDSESTNPVYSTLDEILAKIPSLRTTAAYLVFCDGRKTVTMEKDYKTAVVRSSSSFITVANHDQENNRPSKRNKGGSHFGLSLVSGEAQDVGDLIAESHERQRCVQERWDNAVRHQQPAAEPPRDQRSSRSSMTLRKRRAEWDDKRTKEQGQLSWEEKHAVVTDMEVREWLSTYPVLNEATHFATVLDPHQGRWRG
ncbi:beta subunit of N-acylethanolamine-hydrolyzing acid amidase-domain-containing protein [Penicillium chermesinum]|uniref:ceramidase n=1 Tax=Penicillium chermesinum TaxID=63820 RepID=A0A9W9TI88_9EURO|nr:beta subunit of N-acylethanolamine-hydrolyzing acid amidase-domain-containing protein [Penicillium chermesinum]KAJ5223683.1 beta subunit of N-acylethanolamine-hydrolyzing acid amidase-domain-containing protein [Penicillium chermesinum]